MTDLTVFEPTDEEKRTIIEAVAKNYAFAMRPAQNAMMIMVLVENARLTKLANSLLGELGRPPLPTYSPDLRKNAKTKRD